MHEVRSIPAAPRRIRLGPILAHRWPMALTGAVMAGFGGLVSWMLLLAAGAKPSDQHRLDQGPTERVEATVERVSEEWIRGPRGRKWQWVHYDFTYGDVARSGASMAPFEQFDEGMQVEVELLPDEPNRNRVVGSMLHFDRVWLAPQTWFTAIVVPGTLLLLCWLAGVLHLRHVLIHGDVSSGTVLTANPVRWWLPEMVRVTFEFRDHRAVLRRGRHWLRARSALGRQVQHQVHTGWFEPVPVLHARRFPQWNRMVSARDFLRSIEPTEKLENAG